MVPSLHTEPDLFLKQPWSQLKPMSGVQLEVPKHPRPDEKNKGI